MDTFCHSCAAPLAMPNFKGPSENHCKYCTDDKGNLKSRSDVEKSIVDWFKTWQPDLNDGKALARARHYMNAMPAWAKD